MFNRYPPTGATNTTLTPLAALGELKPYEALLLFKGGFDADAITKLRGFIVKSDELGQNIDAQFAGYTKGNPASRGARAEFDLLHIPRTGWVARGVAPENAGNILGHSHTLARFIAAYADDRLPTNRDHMVELAKIHDKIEALTGDFSPMDKEKYDKQGLFKPILDAMAVCILYESSGLRSEKALITEYETKSSEESKIVSSFDKCLAIMEALQLEARGLAPRAGLADEVLGQQIAAKKEKEAKGASLWHPACEDLLAKLQDPAQREAIMQQFEAAQQPKSQPRSR